jgi:nucleoside-diphosphate-sugar epimerase
MAEHILITGGAGFIGTVLIEHLNAHGYTTSCIDRQPQPAASGYGFVRDLLEPRMFEDTLKWLDARRSGVTRVIHLAAQVGRLFGEDDLRHTVRSNAEMTTIVASVTGRFGIPLAYSSTSEVYGDQGDRVCRENSLLELPHNLYGVSKRWGEEVARLYNPEGLILWRLSMPYGPGAPPGRGRRAIDNMLWQARHGKPIPVHRGAERSWCWVGDTVAALRMTIEAPGYGPSVYNVGRDDDARSMLEIAELACAITGADPSLIELIDPPAGQTAVKRLATEKIRGLGWKPTVELDEGIRKLDEWIMDFDENGQRKAA